ncbi:MAG TPA: L-serine ammonia-lyase, iron-sulfur-dependent, subunit alpha [Candidatus Limiplasma sp.]|nr:L-serine ammonia-lyase, iron-sulfur-dependent, subunit alpha [Candidatus Limiplasma sp.]HRX08999.1 L-serine ammonia-lyase, iron-sulfur-dependent, subunit alpha [Candidatus Limiplasma sp.]
MDTIASLLKAAKQHGSIAQAAIAWQAKEAQTDVEVTRRMMADRLDVMKESLREGLNPDLRSVSGRVGGNAAKLNAAANAKLYGISAKASAYALAIAEDNACMGKIVAAPTAGSCGILPGVLFAAQEALSLSDDALVDAMFVAAAIGHVIAMQATVSGAEGGCQAECGSAAAMAAAAYVQLMHGTDEQAISACGFVLMNTMGLVCDPVDGLVEIPCVYRNASGAAQALNAAQMALAGLVCPLDADCLILTMKDVGSMLPASLRETGEGGCAACACCHTDVSK